MGLNLLEKTELWIHNITLKNANLTDIGQAAAHALGLPEDEVLVVDVRDRHITLDVLSVDIPIENITGKAQALLSAIKSVGGVSLGDDAYVHSNGILGLLCAEEPDPAGLNRKVYDMVNEMRGRIARRAIVFSTGFEVAQGLIEDTNTPYLKSILENNGYTVETGTVIHDDASDVEEKLSDAVSRAFGLIITTGGVGAEDKDHTVEGVLRVDPQAATPYIMKFRQGTGRHVKDGVRIAVGEVGPCRIIAFPGPNDEVKAGIIALLDCLDKGLDNKASADIIASALANRIREKQRPFNHDTHTRHQKEEC